MRVYTGRGLGDFYYSLIRDITNKGREVTVRGERRLEMPYPVVLVYEKPDACWMNIPGRKFNPFFALAEVIWILAGNGNAEWISYYNSEMMKFNDGQPDNHGAYGLRLRKWRNHNPYADDESDIDQMNHVIRKLSADSYSTQATMCLWDPVRDNLVKSKDYPCNNMVYYSLRNGTLDQTVVIRSNDLVLGTPVNAIQFGHIHAYMAGRLKVKVGTLTYFVQNLHYYLDKYPPKIGHLVNLAFGDENPPTEPGAIACGWSAREVDEEIFQSSNSTVGTLREHADQPEFLSKLTFTRGGSYWRYLIPKMVWLFTMVKNKVPGDYVAQLKELPYPFPELAVDFWQDFKNPVAQELIEGIRGK